MRLTNDGEANRLAASAALLRIIFLFSMVGFLASCAGVAPGQLKPVDNGPKFELTSDFSYEEYFSVSGARWRYTLKAGYYQATKADGTGVFYVGPAECFNALVLPSSGWLLHEENFNKVVSTSDCGIYVPLSSSQPPKVFVVIGSGRTLTQGKLQPVHASAVDPVSVTQPTIANAVPNATPLQAGVGAGIAGGIISGIISAEQGNFNFYRNQPDPQALRSVLPDLSDSAR